MKIEIEKIMPHPLVDHDTSASEIWDTNITLKQGDNYLIDGMSGRGKTTFLLTIYGLRHDYNGEITYDGKNHKTLTLNDWAELRAKHFSVIFQNLRLFPHLTALENLMLKAELTDFCGELKIRELANRLNVEWLLDKPCAQLSQGQQQRMAIIRALLQPFNFLFIDEPFSNLDVGNTQLACQLISREAKSQGASIVHASLGEEFDFVYENKYKV